MFYRPIWTRYSCKTDNIVQNDVEQQLRQSRKSFVRIIRSPNVRPFQVASGPMKLVLWNHSYSQSFYMAPKHWCCYNRMQRAWEFFKRTVPSYVELSFQYVLLYDLLNDINVVQRMYSTTACKFVVFLSFIQVTQACLEISQRNRHYFEWFLQEQQQGSNSGSVLTSCFMSY